MRTSHKHWIVRYKSGQPSPEEVDAVLETLEKYSFAVVDDGLPKMALVAGSQDAVTAMQDDLAEGWSITQVTRPIPVPSTKKKLKK